MPEIGIRAIKTQGGWSREVYRVPLGTKKISEDMTENFLELMKDTNS